MHQSLSKNVKLTRHSVAVAAGTTDIEPAAGIDMANYDGVMFVVAFGAITTNAVTSIKLQQSDDSGGSPDSFGDLLATSVTVADSGDDKLYYIDIYRPLKRYVRLVVDRGTQNAVVDGIVAIQYGPRTLPVVHDTTTVGGGETHVTPSEGTA